MKNKVSYTNIWLNYHPDLWHEHELRKGFKIIVIDKIDAPKIVRKRVHEINMRRYQKNAPWYYAHNIPINTLNEYYNFGGEYKYPIEDEDEIDRMMGIYYDDDES